MTSFPPASGKTIYLAVVVRSSPSTTWLTFLVPVPTVRNQVDYPVMATMIITGAVGMHYGARLTGRVSLATLLLIMGLVLSVVGALLVGRSVIEGF